MKKLVEQSELTRLKCGYQEILTMPLDARQWFLNSRNTMFYSSRSPGTVVFSVPENGSDSPTHPTSRHVRVYGRVLWRVTRQINPGCDG